jgi:hypothetical protein
MKQPTLIRQQSRIFKRCLSRTFPLPLRGRAKVRGRDQDWSPSPQSFSPVKAEEAVNLTAGDKSANVLLLSLSSPLTSPGHQNRKSLGLGLKIGKKTAAVVLVLLWMVLPGSVLAAERKSDLCITYSPPHISVEARGVKLREVLRDVSVKVGFELTDYGIPDKDLTVSVEDSTVEELLRQLLRGENYGVVYREKDGAISKLLLLSPPAYAHAAPMSENQQIRTEVSRGSEGLTVFSAAPSYQPARPERKRENRAESKPRVEDILRVHAMPGMPGSGTFPQSSTPNASQPLGRSTPAFSATGATSDSFAITTRLAQQNLKALTHGLATATHPLLNYPANK